MEDQQDDGPLLEGSVLFYTNPEPLDNVLHQNLKVRSNSDRPFDFAAGAQVMPLVVSEFQHASTAFPIIFLGDQLTPLAVTSIDGSGNLFVDLDGSWATGTYMPVYLRRYPFVLADSPEEERLLVCIERNSPLFSEDGDIPLFDGPDQPSAYTKECINFCSEMEQDRRRTVDFVDYVKKLDLFEMRQITQTTPLADGSEDTEVRGQFWGISPAKLAALSGEQLVEMRDNGALAAIYAHLNSQANWDRLTMLERARRASAITPLATFQ